MESPKNNKNVATSDLSESAGSLKNPQVITSYQLLTNESISSYYFISYQRPKWCQPVGIGHPRLVRGTEFMNHEIERSWTERTFLRVILFPILCMGMLCTAPFLVLWEASKAGWRETVKNLLELKKCWRQMWFSSRTNESIFSWYFISYQQMRTLCPNILSLPLVGGNREDAEWWLLTWNNSAEYNREQWSWPPLGRFFFFGTNTTTNLSRNDHSTCEIFYQTVIAFSPNTVFITWR